jgi:hypothetical protein
MTPRATENAVAHPGKDGLAIPCCPPLIEKPCDERMRFRYRLPFRPQLNDRRATVDVTLVFEYERCGLGTALGDLQHTISLLPGEKVRLFVSDKSSRWSYDRESSLAYRHERTSSESHLTFGFAKVVSDLSIAESSSVNNSFEESWAEGGGGASFNFLGIIEVGGGGGGGSYSADSLRDFARSLTQHAESASSYVAASVRASRSVSVGEVETREHAEGESQAHYESSSRTISNENRCHVVNYFVWQLMKLQRIRWRLVAIETQVNDSAAPTAVSQTPRLANKVAVIPQAVLATSENRLVLERADRTSTVERLQGTTLPGAGLVAANRLSFTPAALAASVVMEPDLRSAAVKAVQQQLEKAGMIKADGTPTDKIIAELSWERQELIPTGGLVVKGCIDECSVCEPARQKEIALELEQMELQNQLLKRQIELLEKHADYRCCPVHEEPVE